MKNNLVKKILPHFIAVLIFLIVSVLFCKPVLEGNVLNQHDVKAGKGLRKMHLTTKKNMAISLYGIPIVFSGMPNYQIALDGKTYFAGSEQNIFTGAARSHSLFFYRLHLFLYSLPFTWLKPGYWYPGRLGLCVFYL